MMSVAMCLLLYSFAVAVISPWTLFSKGSREIARFAGDIRRRRCGPQTLPAAPLPTGSYTVGPQRRRAVADSALPLSLLILSMYVDRNINFSHQKNRLLALAKWNDRGPIPACYLARPRA
jgi:hypothetical protein